MDHLTHADRVTRCRVLLLAAGTAIDTSWGRYKTDNLFCCSVLLQFSTSVFFVFLCIHACRVKCNGKFRVYTFSFWVFFGSSLNIITNSLSIVGTSKISYQFGFVLPHLYKKHLACTDIQWTKSLGRVSLLEDNFGIWEALHAVFCSIICTSFG